GRLPRAARLRPARARVPATDGPRAAPVRGLCVRAVRHDGDGGGVAARPWRTAAAYPLRVLRLLTCSPLPGGSPMRRAVIVLGTTAAGLAALLSFKTHSLAAPVPSAPAPSTGMPQATASGTGPSSMGATSPAARATPK